MFNLESMKRLAKAKNLRMEEVINQVTTITPQGFYAAVRNGTVRFDTVVSLADYFGVSTDYFRQSDDQIVSEPVAGFEPKSTKQQLDHYRELYEECQKKCVKLYEVITKHGIKAE